MLWRPLGTFVVVIAGWWIAVRLLDVPAFLLPAPPEIVAALAEHHAYLLRHAGQTLGHALGGFGIAAAAGVAVAMLLATSAWVRGSVFPLLVALQAVPKVAVAPLLVVWLGFGPSSKVALVVLLCFFPVVVNTGAGLSSIPAELAELARSLTASRWRALIKLRLPWAMPYLFTGLKVAISLALIGAVVAELTTPNAGLGTIILRSGQAANGALAFAAVTLLAGIGIVLYYSVVLAERRLLPWARATTA
jgi:NitT/TauT family transport system permease protein